MHIHILGMDGVFMGGVAILARQMGYAVTGSSASISPSLVTLLESEGIGMIKGFDPSQLAPNPDLVVVGNTISRGNPCIEYVLNRNLRYVSAPQWLQEEILHDRWVLAVSGTHGKKVTVGMLTWILEYCGYQPGFLASGVLENVGASSRLGKSMFFVVEADEYDSAFFDERSKFLHYHPRTLIVNNFNFDQMDTLDSQAEIKRQLHQLIQTVPENGRIFSLAGHRSLDDVLELGCWSEQEKIGPRGNWQAEHVQQGGREFDVTFKNQGVGHVSWGAMGEHCVDNALLAIAAARHVGVTPDLACEALAMFKRNSVQK